MMRKYLWLLCFLPGWINAQTLDTALIQNYLERAQIAADSFHHRAAADYGKKILAEYEAANITSIDSIQVRAYQWIAYNFSALRELETADEYLKKSEAGINALGLDSTLLAAEHQIIAAFILNLRSKYPESIELYHGVLKILQKHLPANHVRVADVNRMIGSTYNSQTKGGEALVYLEKSLALCYETLDSFDHRIAKVYTKMGQSASYEGEYRQAIVYLENALEIQLRTLGKYHLETEDTYVQLSIAYHFLGAFAKAIACLEHCLDIYQNVPQVSSGSLVVIYGRIGASYTQQNNYEKGHFYLQRAVDLSRQEPEGKQYFLIPALNYLGIVYMFTDRIDEAILTYQEAIAKDVTGNYLNITYHNLALCYNMNGDYESADKYFQKTLDIYVKNNGPNHPGDAKFYRTIAENYSKLNQLDQARSYLEKTLSLFSRTLGERHIEMAVTYGTLGMVYQEHEQHQRALTNFNKAIELYGINSQRPQDFSGIALPVNLQKVLLNRIKTYQRLYEKQGHEYTDTLEVLYEQLLALQEHVYREMPEHGYHPEFSKVQFPIAEYSIRFYLERGEPGDIERAFQIAEQNKSRQLQAHIRQRQVEQPITGIPDSLLNKEYDLNIDIAYYDKLRFEVAAKATPDQELLTQYKEKLFNLRQERSKLLDQFKTVYPDYYRFRYSNETPSVSRLQEVIPEDQAVVEYFTGDSSIFVFVIGKDFIKAQNIKRDFPLNQLIERLRSGIYEYWMLPEEQDGLGYEESKHQYQAAAVELYDRLFSPVANGLPEKLLLIPDGPLCFIPFDALLTEKPQKDKYKDFPYLLRQHQISYNYSFTFYNYSLERLPSRAEYPLLSLAPSFTGPERQLRSLTALREGHGVLPNNGLEAETIAALFEGEVLSGKQATKQRFMELAANYKVLHLATHSKSNDVQGDFSYIAFQSTGDTTNQESRLYAQELYHLNLDAEMVVLSACESGLGELKRGEGVTGMASAFAYAGAKSTITSLWSVSDLETTRLMEKFYTNLQTGMEKDAALRRAKLDYLEQNQRTAPFFWASFIPVGDMQPLVLPNRGLRWWMLIGGVLLALLFMIRVRKPAATIPTE